jgi:hypothetical protein
MQQMGNDNIFNLKALAQQLAQSGALKGADLAGATAEADEDDVPQLVENFDEASKDEK